MTFCHAGQAFVVKFDVHFLPALTSYGACWLYTEMAWCNLLL